MGAALYRDGSGSAAAQAKDSALLHPHSIPPPPTRTLGENAVSVNLSGKKADTYYTSLSIFEYVATWDRLIPTWKMLWKTLVGLPGIKDGGMPSFCFGKQQKENEGGNVSNDILPKEPYTLGSKISLRHPAVLNQSQGLFGPSPKLLELSA